MKNEYLISKNQRKIAETIMKLFPSERQKKKQKNIIEMTNKDCENKNKINVENYLVKQII